jgi:hypothetical protein
MNAVERRQVIAHGAMGLAACIGAYMVLVDGPRKQLATAAEQNKSLTNEVRSAESLRDQIPAMTAALTRAGQDEAQLRDMGRLAREERALFAAMMSLAGTHRVRLDELNPVRAAKAGMPSEKNTNQVNDVTVGYSMVAIASYEDLAAFAAAIRNDLGYAVIRSMRLTPVQDEHEKLVRAVIETEHYSFDASPAHPPMADAGGR